jgi:two-component system, cell cycle sensor histidine kinase and response regulator CckA
MQTSSSDKAAARPLQVLHLEDRSSDAELVQHRLEAGGLNCELVRVVNRQQFVEALAGGGFDVVLCDYNLPDYDGISALKLARETHPDTPVLLISGSLDEEEAVKSLQHGAADYLFKDRLVRLVPAVKRALASAEEHRKHRQAESELRETQERLMQLAELSSEVLWLIGLDPERMLYASPAAKKVWGVPPARLQASPRAWIEIIHPEDSAQVLATWDSCLKGGSPGFEAEYRVMHPDGSVRWVLNSGTAICDASGRVIRMGGVAKDISERKRAERQALRTQRLESLGTLASGVAHDLNNALAPILMATELLRLDYPGASGMIDTVESSARRGADMVRQLLTFAKGAEGARLLVQPQHLLKEMGKIIRGTFPKNIQLQLNYEREIHPILGDATQLHQVLLNLCVNARDAMPHGGMLTLEAANVDIDDAYASGVCEARPGRYVVLRVHDTGAGMPPEIVERIFEPFFSTKAPDKGTGLGLSTVSGIIKGHGGFIHVYSVPGQGTAFSLYLPASESASPEESPANSPGSSFLGNGETILVVDDEIAVR